MGEPWESDSLTYHLDFILLPRGLCLLLEELVQKILQMLLSGHDVLLRDLRKMKQRLEEEEMSNDQWAE